MRYVCFLASLFFYLLHPVCANPVHTICFVPGQDCRGLIVRMIGEAKETIRVQAYGFTSAQIANALVDADRRGVEVRVILDKSQRRAKRSQIGLLRDAGILVLLDHDHAIAHNKVIIIDARIVVTGSFNFTDAAQLKNAENLIVVDDPDVAALYEENWNRHAEHAQR